MRILETPGILAWNPVPFREKCCRLAPGLQEFATDSLLESRSTLSNSSLLEKSSVLAFLASIHSGVPVLRPSRPFGVGVVAVEMLERRA